MFAEAVKARNQNYKILASFQGIDLFSDSDKSKVDPKELPPGVTDAKSFVFGDPESYADMSQEEKEALTQKMMANHKQWSENRVSTIG